MKKEKKNCGLTVSRTTGKKMNEKKKRAGDLEWATAHFGAGSRYNKLYRDTRLGRLGWACSWAPARAQYSREGV